MAVAFACLSPAMAMAQVASGPASQAPVSQPVVQSLPNRPAVSLNAALARLARNPRDITALIDAGNAALAVGDVDAAIGFFSRAGQVAPTNPMVKAGLASALVQSGNPFDAIPMFEEAERAGASGSQVTLDRGLAYDLVGDNAKAQGYYRQVLATGSNDEALRRLALSQAIAGDRNAAETTLAPLLQRQDKAAWRVRAFSLAILGQTEEGVSIANAMLPNELATSIAPYLRYMPRLTAAQQAAAVNFGQFPRASEIGQDDPRVALYAPPKPARRPRLASGDAALTPAGEPLGRRQRGRNTRQPAAETRPALAVASAPVPPAPVPPAPPQASRETAPAPATQLAVAEAKAPPVIRTPAAPAAAPLATVAPATPIAPVVPAAPTVPPVASVAAVAPVAASAAPVPPVAAPAPVVTAPVATVQPAPALSAPAPVSTALVAPAQAPAAVAPAPVASPGFNLAALPSANTPSTTTPPATTPAVVPSPAPAAATSPVPPTPPVPTTAPPPARRPSLAEAFSEFTGPSAEVAPAAGAVDMRNFRPSRETSTPRGEAAAPTGKGGNGKPAVEKPTPPSHPSRIWVQLATGRDRAALAFDWRRMSREAEAVFRGKRPSVSAWGQSQRLLAGPFDTAAAANAFVTQLRRADIAGAFVWTSPAGQVVDTLPTR